MKKMVQFFVICAVCLFVGGIARAGVEPSPFKEVIQANINLIIQRLTPLTQNSTGGIPSNVQELAIEVVNYLQAAQELPVKRQVDVMQATVIMTRITAVMFDPQPEPPGYQSNALQILKRLSLVSFDPQPEPPGHMTKTLLTVLDRISAKGFDPQPEPPGYEMLENTMNALDGISRIAINPQPEPPGKTSEVMSVFEAVSAVAFDPQPEPPGYVADMFNILNLMKKVAVPETTVIVID